MQLYICCSFRHSFLYSGRMKRRANRTCPANHVLGRGLALAGAIPIPPSPIEQVHNFFALDISNLFNQLERCCAYQQRFQLLAIISNPPFHFRKRPQHTGSIVANLSVAEKSKLFHMVDEGVPSSFQYQSLSSAIAPTRETRVQ